MGEKKQLTTKTRSGSEEPYVSSRVQERGQRAAETKRHRVTCEEHHHMNSMGNAGTALLGEAGTLEWWYEPCQMRSVTRPAFMWQEFAFTFISVCLTSCRPWSGRETSLGACWSWRLPSMRTPRGQQRCEVHASEQCCARQLAVLFRCSAIASHRPSSLPQALKHFRAFPVVALATPLIGFGISGGMRVSEGPSCSGLRRPGRRIRSGAPENST